MRGHAVGQVAGGGTSERVELELPRHARGDRHNAILERPRRVLAVVLDVQTVQTEKTAEIPRADQRRQAGSDVDSRLRVARQQLSIAPHGGRAPFDVVSGDGASHRLVVVEDFERAEAELAHVNRVKRIDAAALSAFEVFRERHDDRSSG